MSQPFVLAIDQGTTGSRVFCMNEQGQELAISYKEHKQYYPNPGWVEHDALEIWHNIAELILEALQKGKLNPKDCKAIGITNQRETIVAWDKRSGVPIHPAIVWQCRRTSDHIRQLKEQKLEDTFRRKTGLVLDPYFSGTKISWLLKNVSQARKMAENGDLLIGTMETWLIWNLTEGQTHKSDYTNASRTLVFNIEEKKWDTELLNILQIPASILPEAVPSCHLFGQTRGVKGLLDGTPIWGAAGDQQAALYGQACVEPGQAKNTYGTGCFLLMNTGDKRVHSKKGLLTTLGCNAQGEPAYVLEGAIFIAGAAVQWLRDSLKIIDTAAQTEALSLEAAQKEQNVVLVPAFVGLGAPYWQMDARGALLGLSLDTGRKEIAQATLHAIAMQSYDLVSAMEQETELTLNRLRVDGGACKNRYLMQFQADVLQREVHLPRNLETTALGAALLAGVGASFYDPKKLETYNPYANQFNPSMPEKERHRHISNWQKAIATTLQYRV